MNDLKRGGCHRTRWIAVPVLALAIVAGCSTDTTPPSVIVTGDTMTALEQVQLQATLHPLYTTTYVVRSDGRIGHLAALVHAAILTTSTPDIAITDVGTTDALRSGRTAGAASPLAPLLSATSGIPCVVLTTVNVRADEADDGTVAARINHQIKELARSNATKYKVVDWNEFVSTLPDASVPTYLQGNDIAETPVGAAWLTKADLAAVRACGSTRQPTVVGPNNG